MPNTKISALTAATTPLAGTEVLPIVQAGTTDQVSVANLTAGRAVSGLSFATANMTMGASAITVGAAATYNLNSGATQYLTAGFTPGAGRPAALLYSVGSSHDMMLKWTDLLRFYDASDNLKFVIDNLNSRVETYMTFLPNSDNVLNLGGASNRWATIFAGNGTINTSDAREKQQVRSISDKEKIVAGKIKGLLKAFKFNDAVSVKGEKARIHFGILAQELEQAFQDEGLNPDEYGMFCYDRWSDEFEDAYEQVTVVDENGKEVVESRKTGEKIQTKKAGDRYGVRYEQVLAFVIAAM
jgi:hypothetical protein